jgi:hypothetical protein
VRCRRHACRRCRSSGTGHGIEGALGRKGGQPWRRRAHQLVRQRLSQQHPIAGVIGRRHVTQETAGNERIERQRTGNQVGLGPLQELGAACDADEAGDRAPVAGDPEHRAMPPRLLQEKPVVAHQPLLHQRQRAGWQAARAEGRPGMPPCGGRRR